MTHKCCSPDCAAEWARLEREKKERKELAKRKRETREKLNEMKGLGVLMAEAQVAFNAYVRARDIRAGHGCIDCGKPFEPNKPGGSIDAGHYLSRGSSSHLKFNENNCFAQRKNCNRPGGTTRDAFRAGVEARIGLEALEALEADHHIHKWTKDELRGVKALYVAKLKELNRRDV
jgi:hypothetical protein